MGKRAQGVARSGLWAGWAASWRPATLHRDPPPPMLGRLAEVALLAMLCWVLLAPLAPAGADDPGAPVVLDAPARAGLFAQFDPFARENAGGDGGVLPLTLLGTRSTADGRGGSAILAGADGVQHVVAQGQEALPGLRLVQVAFDHVVLLRAGGRATLALATPQGRDADSAPQPAKLALVPAADGGELVPADGGGQGWGLLPDDRIVAIAGAPVRGGEDARRLDALLAAGRSVTVTVRRGGRDLALALGPQDGGR